MTHRIFVLEDHPLMRQMVREYVARLPGMEVCGDAATAEAALEELAAATPDLVLVDVALPGMNGIDFVVEAMAQQPTLCCLMLSGHAEAAYVERALAAGARGFVLKGDPAALAEAIPRVLQGEIYISVAPHERAEAPAEWNARASAPHPSPDSGSLDDPSTR